MLDFLEVETIQKKKNLIEVQPSFLVKKSNDLMIRGGDFYGVWCDEIGKWSTEEDDVIAMIDHETNMRAKELRVNAPDDVVVKARYIRNSNTGLIDQWHKYCQKQMRDNYKPFNQKLIFQGQLSKRNDYSTKALPYSLKTTSIEAYDKLISTLYNDTERHKIEWGIGSIIAGDSPKVQKLYVLYGKAGTGKSTVLNIIEQLFEGYFCHFKSKDLANNDAFSLEAFNSDPLVAVEHDGDLSRIQDNTILNSLISHETLVVNEKFKRKYQKSFNTTLFIGSNNPVEITDMKSGMLRRLIDISPTGNTLPSSEYRQLVSQIAFELGGIALHCRDIYLENPNAYDHYRPDTMIMETNDFYDFASDMNAVIDDDISLAEAWRLYKAYAENANLRFVLTRRSFIKEFKTYFKDYAFENKMFIGFKHSMFTAQQKRDQKDSPKLIEFKEQPSIFDTECADCLAQYGKTEQTPTKAWSKVKSTLRTLDTSKIHYVKLPENHIVIDFDIPNDKGEKDYERNLQEASKWPPTYAELSKSGAGIHLHYLYTGDVSKLSSIYSDHVEIKVFSGNSSLRRKLSKCNNIPIATISSGLPLKGEKPVVNLEVFRNENSLRKMIQKNLNKEYHANTTPSVQFIHKILTDAYESGVSYDVTDMRGSVLAFAAQSTNQAPLCIKLVNEMPFQSEKETPTENYKEDKPIIFYDVEVFPNLFVVCWVGTDEKQKPVTMINPSAKDIAELAENRLIGFNNRRYDNHILYARMIGYNNEQLFNLSNKIINTPKGQPNNNFFREAYNLSYTDIHDFASKKQSLKKWEIEMGIHHQELGLPWDQPVQEELWEKVADYCCNDVIATRATFNYLQGDWIGRCILAKMACLSENDTTNALTTRIIFGGEKNPELNYVNLAETFPGYEFKEGKNLYRETDIGRGGYIISWPGIYHNVAVLDISSMHPNSIRAMNLFGEYTKRFTDILDARVAIKHGELEQAKDILRPYLTEEDLDHYLSDSSKAKQLAQALKIAINSVYGLTAASFKNPFKDDRNANNVVALRGALFMRTLQDEVINRGFNIVAIKTDSIKIADATPEIIDFCLRFAREYGYEFEHEATYSRMCQTNDADYIAREADEWTVTGKFFARPYVLKNLFTKQPIVFEDYCEVFETKKGALYLDFNETLPDDSLLQKQLKKLIKQDTNSSGKIPGEENSEKQIEDIRKEIEKCHDYTFVGRVGSFIPVRNGIGGGILVRMQDDKPYNAAGTTGYRWVESELLRDDEALSDKIDMTYFRAQVDETIETLNQYGDAEVFIHGDDMAPWQKADDGEPPWDDAAGDEFSKR